MLNSAFKSNLFQWIWNIEHPRFRVWTEKKIHDWWKKAEFFKLWKLNFFPYSSEENIEENVLWILMRAKSFWICSMFPFSYVDLISMWNYLEPRFNLTTLKLLISPNIFRFWTTFWFSYVYSFPSFEKFSSQCFFSFLFITFDYWIIISFIWWC